MTTHRPMTHPLSPRFSWILLTAIATLLCVPAIGSADKVVDKKVAVDKKIDAKKAAVKQGVDKQASDKSAKSKKRSTSQRFRKTSTRQLTSPSRSS